MIDKVMSTLFKTADQMRVTPSKHAEKIEQKPFTLEQNPGAELARELTKTHRANDAKPTEQINMPDRQDQLAYVPLPLRSPLYEDARFYWKLKSFSAKTDINGEAKVIFNLNTDTLGSLWFTLTSQRGVHLAIQCITENNYAAEVFRASTKELQQELTEVGYQDVIVSCRIQAGVRSAADIDPDFAAGENHSFLDVQV